MIRGPAVVPGELVDAQSRAERVMADAKQEAERLVAEARADADDIRRRAREEGDATARAEAAAMLVAVAEIKARALAESETAIRTLALAVARKIVAAELELQPAHVQRIVESVLDRARRARDVVIRVHADDVEHVRRIDRARHATIEVDPTIARGGCIVETELGKLDGRLEIQLAALERALT